MARYERYSRRRKRHAAQSGQRLDIQGLRMVAVLTVFANHLWGWPHGGFVGVDVFFVISGFLITGNLLRGAEKTGRVSFRHFYWNRVRRIMPAATVVLTLTVGAAYLLFQPFRAREVGVDAIWAFAFASNWWFAVEDTDYFNADTSVSPLQHYWSLSIEEQFYFVWPALIFLISLLVLRKAWTHGHRMLMSGVVMGVIVAASFGWAVYKTATAPAWAYFDTFARVWELGVGALLACSVGVLARIPTVVKPVLSWAGLAVIAASLFLISDGVVWFPAPWALLPVAGAALVIAAGVGVEPDHQPFLTHPVSGYIGDISYSLYLVHWPIIVMLATLMDGGLFYTITVVALAFAAAVGSYHFVENPLRKADWTKLRDNIHEIRRRRFETSRTSQIAAVGVIALVAVAGVAYIVQPNAYEHAAPPPLVLAQEAGPADTGPQFDPLAAALQDEISQAVSATEWPQMEPSMEVQLEPPGDIGVPQAFGYCGGLHDYSNNRGRCQWGSPTAPIRVVIVGDSIASRYAWSLSQIAENSNGQIQLYDVTLGGCPFVDAPIFNSDDERLANCYEGRPRQVEFINSLKPTVVVISNVFGKERSLDGGGTLTLADYRDAMVRQINMFRGNVNKVVLLPTPPGDKNPQECFGNRSSVPADCLGRVLGAWDSQAETDRQVAELVSGTWIDSRPWFCSQKYRWACPAFVGSVPVKYDTFHMGWAYATKIHPVMWEAFKTAGVF